MNIWAYPLISITIFAFFLLAIDETYKNWEKEKNKKNHRIRVVKIFVPPTVIALVMSVFLFIYCINEDAYDYDFLYWIGACMIVVSVMGFNINVLWSFVIKENECFFDYRFQIFPFIKKRIFYTDIIWWRKTRYSIDFKTKKMIHKIPFFCINTYYLEKEFQKNHVKMIKWIPPQKKFKNLLWRLRRTCR